jgi:hypothetical protein
MPAIDAALVVVKNSRLFISNFSLLVIVYSPGQCCDPSRTITETTRPVNAADCGLYLANWLCFPPPEI